MLPTQRRPYRVFLGGFYPETLFLEDCKTGTETSDGPEVLSLSGSTVGELVSDPSLIVP